MVFFLFSLFQCLNFNLMTLTTEGLKPMLLTDSSRLSEIYNFRVDVWGQHEKSAIVNRRLFPEGWKDALDESAFHWIVTNEEGKLIAAARLNIFNSVEVFPYQCCTRHLSMPLEKPFAFFSRLVVLPEYRGEGLSFQLAYSRMQFCEARGIKWMQAYINNERVKKLYSELGFVDIGQAAISYHPSSAPHAVNVLIKEY